MIKENIIEKVILFFISVSFLVGIWHGFPFTNIVADEMFFSGSVLRSMEAQTFLPLPFDVPYGTLTFYLSYIIIGFSLVILFPFAGFNVASLKFLVVESPYIVYFSSRLLSLFIALISLYLFNSVLKRYVCDYRNRLIIVFILFGNILVNLLFHTSKVWILSTFLYVVSFYFLVKFFEERESHIQKKYIWYSVVVSFLAFSNFPFMGVSLISIPIILFSKFNDKPLLKTLFFSSLVGLALFLLITLSNFSGIKSQVYSIIYDYSFSPGAKIYNLTLFESFISHFKKIFLMFPVLVFFGIYGLIKGKIKNTKLFWISLVYISTFTFILIFVDRWSVSPQSALRYLFPLPFFIAFFIASLEFDFKKILLVPVFIVFLYLVISLYYISIPTTSHEFFKFINNNFYSKEKAILINYVGVDAPLLLNKKTAVLFKDSECGSLCKITIKQDLQPNFNPLIIDYHTDNSKIPNFIDSEVYLILRSATTSKDLELYTSFTNNVSDNAYYSLDSSGNYFDLSYFTLRNFGPNLYIYKKVSK